MRAVRNCLLFIPAILPNVASSVNFGSHHSRGYAAYDYDLTTPQYTPDGRLLQVEYATTACIREDSNPIVSVGVSVPGGGDTILIMATVSSPPPSSSSLSTIQINPSQKGRGSTDGQAEERDENEIKSFMTGAHQRTQFRIIEIPLSASNHCSSLHGATTSTILVGLSGLLSDATSLLRIVYSQLEEEQRMFGWHRLGLSPVGIRAVDDSDSGSATNSLQPSSSKQSQSIATQPSETVLRLSRAIADKCQTHAFGGGLRPLGASLLLAGVDICHDTIEKGGNARQKHGARMAMCETHPNGGRRSHVSTEKSSNESKLGDQEFADVSINSPQIMVTGGPAKSQSRLKSLIDSRLRQLYQRVGSYPKNSSSGTDNNNIVEAKEKDYETLFLRQVLQTTLSSLVEEWRERGDPLMSSSTASSAVNHGQGHLGQQQPTLPQMEVVIALPTRGTFRLTETDVARLMRPLPSVINS
mmetsp:Transcript_2542/g.5423  ORF Transcript_2542/g.5423 Transcript_2542/m.5423 type:complete len:470 (-) Transcript_2542:45-1454(-)|eukprot:CAMPEP_0172299386 /NCGR_PEP_ID=MMETSP1058-20130122/1720_1 /TAXON_ID=83371 /ORGANISM="Detonula confervacea, Strain CCMP 353" /LENGTH=469 /DNA_ID=CAMNT_0013008833 /DNA_START=147 /DNA_END=1556 /DNA_ORIENTATION=+